MEKSIMIWITPSEKDANSAALEKRLHNAADQSRTNFGLGLSRFGRTF